MDGDERRRRALVAGKEMLAKYKAERSVRDRSAGNNQTGEPSDEESSRNDVEVEPTELQSTGMNEGISSRDRTYSSVSMSEGEGDGDLEGMAGRVAELEELLQGKEAVVEALNAEIDHLRGDASSPNSSQSHNSSIQHRDLIITYRTKVQEFDRAIVQRDSLIEDLTKSLTQALSTRDALLVQINSLNSMQLVNPNIKNTMELQERIFSLEGTLSDQKMIINQLNSQVAQFVDQVKKLEMEKETQNAEINDYKLQVNQLNEQIRAGAAENNLNIAESLEQQRQCEIRVDKIKRDMQVILDKFTAEMSANASRHKKELQDLEEKHEVELAEVQSKYEEKLMLLKEENVVLADRLNKELPDIESRHAKELSVFQAQLTNYKKTVEDITSKYVAASSILDSKESIERSLEQALANVTVLKQENDTLRFKFDDLFTRYSAAQSLIENSQVHERSMSNRIYDLEKSLSRVSGMSVSMLSELNETSYQTFDEVAIKCQITQQKLEEKLEMEKLLIEKIEMLEDDVRRSNEELEQANLTKRSYEKQLKDMKNTCDKLKSDVNDIKESNSSAPKLFQSSLYFGSDEEGKKQIEVSSRQSDSTELVLLKSRLESCEREIQDLQKSVQQKEAENMECQNRLDVLTAKMKISEEECEKLKIGLFDAYRECAEFRDKLNQTLTMNDSKVDDTGLSIRDSNASNWTMDNYNVADNSVTMESSSTCSENKPAVKGDTLDCANAQLLQFDVLTKEKDDLLKRIEALMKKQSDYDEAVKKLYDRNVEFEKLELEKEQLTEENAKLINRLEDVDLLQGRIDRLNEEKESLVKEIADLIDKHKEEVSVLKLNSSTEVQKLESLSLSVKEETANLDELRAELEMRHTKEMEELRTYFEQKCLQMEKQYSEEVFSQQSKKMSDNDSEIEELTDDLYLGGAGDYLNVPNVSSRSSRTEAPLVDAKEKDRARDIDETPKSKLDNMTKIEATQCDLEQKMQEIHDIKSQYEHKLEEQQKLHKKELYEAKERAGRISLLKAVNQPCQTEWDPISLECSELQAANSRQLKEQVELARFEIINDLQENLQALLLANDPDAEEHWPPEFLELRNKFTNNTWNEMQKLKERHTEELTRLKEQHSRDVAQSIEQHQKEINRIKAECTNQNYNTRQTRDGHSFYESDLIVKRDSLHKTCATLKILVGELIKYFSICEEEVNNTLISEVLKTQLSRSEISATERREVGEDQVDSNLDVAEASRLEGRDILSNSPETKIKRVHFAPQFSGIMSIVNSDDDTLHDLIEEDKDLTDKLKAELSNCLERLKSDSAQVLGISLTPGESKLDLLSKHVLWMTKINEDLCDKLAKTESVIVGYQEESEQLKVKILSLQQKLIASENKKEIITEGYGEHDESGVDVTIQNLTQLQDKARLVLMNGGGESSHLLQLIEELCRHSDKITDDAKRDKEDLQQQIEAADKKLRATRKFLEEQASEREAERDEATRQILALQEQIKKLEREKERDLRITSESSLSPVPTSITPVLQTTDFIATVETLESQMREMTSLMSDTEAKKSETESELKAAVDKIWVLRDVITNLEQQVQAKVEREELLQNQIDQLEEVIAAQTKNQQELAQELDAIKLGSENSQLNEHIGHLQEELRKHKLSSEHFNANSSVLKQMRMELRDMQAQLDKRTKELEALHMCGSNLSLSQPSEDVSIREQIEALRCSTPDDPHSPPTLPLDQLLKLKEKMLKHARAEEVALKRIKDLDMQLTTVKNQNEILQAEQEILQQTTSEQLFQIEAMRGRLEHQKQSAPFAQRQATSRLELQLHDANEKLHSLERTAADKDLEVKDMKSQLDRINQLLMEKEAEIASAVQSENSIIQKLKDRVEVLEEEKKILESKVGMQERAQLELPQLIDSMLTDKNEEIDHLKEQISKKEKQLELYLSLNLDESQLKELVRQAEPKNSARTLSDILSIHSECEDLPEAIREAPNLTRTLIHNVSNLKAVVSSQSKDTIEASPMSLIDASKIDVQVPRLELGSHSLSSTCPQQSRVSIGGELSSSEENSISRTVDDEKSGVAPEKMSANDLSKGRMSMEKPERALEFKETSSVTNDVDDNVVHSSKRDDKSLNASAKRSRQFDNEAMNRQIQDLESQLTEVNEELKIKSLDLIKREAELSTIQRNLKELRTELKDTVESLKRDTIFYKSQYELTQASESKIKKDLLQVENTLKLKTEELKEYKDKMQMNEKIIMELNGENSKLKREANEREEKLFKKCESVVQEKAQELKSLKEIIFEKDITIETIETRNVEIENENKQLYEYKTKYELCSREFDECQNEIQRLTDGLNNRDQIIRRLEEMARRSSLSGGSSPSDNKNQEIHHLQEYLKEKDKVIRQMSDDSKSLHRALETIQSKMKESGNVVELRKKLKEERKINMELKELVERLKKDVERLKNESSRHSEEDVDIEDMVQRELNLSARLDRQIMNAIESESEDGTARPIVKNVYNSLDIEPVDQEQQEIIVQKYNDVRLKLKQANKVNEELIKLKEDLEIEKEMLKSQVAEYEGRILQIKSDLEEESRKVAKLDKDLSTERNMVRNLRVQIQKEQNAMHTAQMHDSELIALLRVKLEASLDVQEKLRADLTLIRREYKSLETQLSAVREQIKCQETEEIPGLTELLETEQRKYIVLAEEHEKEQRKNGELQNTLKRIAAEKNRYEKELEIVVEDKEKLVSSLVLVEGIKEHLDTDLKRTKEELKGREEECEWLQKRIKTMTDAEAKRQHQRSSEHNELKSLRREISNARDVMLDLEADMKQSKKELNKSLERQAQLTRCVKTLTERETELNKKLEIARDEEKRLKDVIADMQNDLQLSVRRELELTDELQRERLSSEKNVPAKFVQKIKELNESIEKHSRDKGILHDKLTKAREEKQQFAGRVRALELQFAQQPTTKAPLGPSVINADMVEKLQHFYGKYLRVDSRRKALAYQKRYLLCVVGGYQLSEQNTLSILAQLTQNQRLYATAGANRKSPRIRFKSAALVIIGIHRMRWMILRWRTGRRVGANAVLGNANQSFMPLPKPTVNHSPPVRDKLPGSGDAGQDGFAFEHYLQRFTNIQQTLNLAMADLETNNLILD